MAELFMEKFNNPLVLGLDHSKMGIFYSIYTE